MTGALTLVAGYEPRAGPVGAGPVGAGAAAFGDGAAAFADAAVAEGVVETRFELLAVAGRGFHPPRFLSIASLATGDAGSLEEPPPADGVRRVWSVLYRRIVEIGGPDPEPFALYLLGVDPPPEATDDELAAFNAFYSEVHLPEVAERRRASRAARYELVRPLRAPPRGAPRYLATYEVDEQAASTRRHAGPPYAAGPAVWQAHTTPWRLWYRRLEPRRSR